MSQKIEELKNFWEELKKNVTFSLKDWEKLTDMLNKLFMRIQDLEESRDKWKKKALEKHETTKIKT